MTTRQNEVLVSEIERLTAEIRRLKSRREIRRLAAEIVDELPFIRLAPAPPHGQKIEALAREVIRDYHKSPDTFDKH
jgi:hypothetical protein